MGIITRLFKRKLTEEQQAEKSRREKEWAEKCYNKGYEFCEKFAIDKHINRINDFANKYPRTFFGIIFGVLIVSFFLNSFISLPGGQDADNLQQIVESPMMQQDINPRNELVSNTLEIMDNLTEIDHELDSLMKKNTLTHNDSIRIKSLLVQADALQQILTGQGILTQSDSTNINK